MVKDTLHEAHDKARKCFSVLDPPDCLYYLISRVSLAVTSALKKGFTQAGMSSVKPAYLGVLWCLWREDGLKAVELARNAGLETSSMTGLLDRMERDGLVVREADPQDRRAQNIYLTDEGRRIQGPLMNVMNAVLGGLTEQIPEAEVETAKKLLRRLLATAHEEGQS